MSTAPPASSAADWTRSRPSRPGSKKAAGNLRGYRTAADRNRVFERDKVAMTCRPWSRPAVCGSILGRLRQGPGAGRRAGAAVGMEQSAVSQQLRMMRHLGLVAGQRSGRTVVYALFDSHVAMPLDEAVYHAEHRRRAPGP